MDDLTQYLPKLLLISGLLLQWMRAFKGVHDAWYHVAAVVLCGVAYLLTMQLTGSTRVEIVRFLVWIPDNLPLVWGGTFVMSNVAKTATSVSASSNPLIPMTNSK